MAGYYPLPAYNPGNALNFQPLDSAISGYKDAQTKNALFGFEQQQAAVQNKRQNALLGLQEQQGAREQTTFDQGQQDRAHKALAATVQAISQAPPDQQQTMWQTLRTHVPDFDKDLQANGVDPNDHVAASRMIFAKAQGYQDPMAARKAEADIAKTNAEAGWYNQRPRTAAGGATTDLIDRLRAENPGMSLEEAITVAKRGGGVMSVDTGTGTALVDRNRGTDVRVVPKDIVGRESLEAQGKAQGTAIADLPRIEANADRALQTIEAIRNHPGKNYGLGLMAPAGYLPATQARGFANLVDQAKGQVFLEAFNSLRGGGQITEAEGAKATQALARLDRAQRPQDFDAALSDLEGVIRNGIKVAKQRSGMAPPATDSSLQSPSSRRRIDLGDGFSAEFE